MSTYQKGILLKHPAGKHPEGKVKSSKMRRTLLTFVAMGLLFALLLPDGGVWGKAYYRWTDEQGTVQISDEPPTRGKYEKIIIPDRRETPSAETIGEKPREEAAADDDPVKRRQEAVVKELEEMVAHYSEVGGITAGKMEALKEAVVIVKKAKMDGTEKDDEFYLKIEELVRAIKDHTMIIGRVHRLLREAKAMKGFPVPPPEEGTE